MHPLFLLLDSDARRRVPLRAVRVAGVGLLLLFATLPARAQLPVTGADQAQPAGSRRAGEPEPDPGMIRSQEKLAERRNEEREKELEADTRKLLELAQALETDVSKTNKNELSLDVIKRAEQIEKLAHSVREKMRGYY